MDARIRELQNTRSKIDAELEMLGRSGSDVSEGNVVTTSGTTGIADTTINSSYIYQAIREKSPEEIIEDLFTYHPANAEQKVNYERVRDAAKHLALQIWKACPYGRDRTNAIDLLRQTVMLANASIALNGRSL